DRYVLKGLVSHGDVKVGRL
ncbi:unnamed protein product, partial [Allacma fusca]